MEPLLTRRQHLRIVAALREEQRDLARAAEARTYDAHETAKANRASAQRVFEKACADYAQATNDEQDAQKAEPAPAAEPRTLRTAARRLLNEIAEVSGGDAYEGMAVLRAALEAQP